MEILTLGNKIKKRRKELSLTLKEIAGDRVTPAQLSYVESDKCKPSLDLLEYISERLGLEIDYLLESEAKQVSKFCRYCLEVAQTEIARRDYKGAVERLEEALKYANQYKLTSYQGEALKLLGHIYKDRNDYVRAVNYFLSALKKFIMLNKLKDIFEIYIELGLAAYSKKYFCSCESYFIKAMELAEKFDNTDMISKIRGYYHLMMLYTSLDDENNALKYAEKTSQCLNFINDRDKYSQAHMAVSMQYEMQNKYDKAVKYAEESFNAYNGVNYIDLIVRIEDNLGNVYLNYNKIQESIKHLYRALDIKKLIKDKTIPLTHILISCTHLAKNDFDKAIDSLNEALMASLNTGSRRYESFVYHEMYRTFYEKGDYLKAEECLKRCTDILESTGDMTCICKCYYEMAGFFSRINMEKETGKYISKAISMYKQSGSILVTDQVKAII